MPQPQLIAYNGTPLPIGATTYLDDNLPITVLAITPPGYDGDHGSVTIRYGWGATDDVDPVRLRAYIDD